MPIYTRFDSNNVSSVQVINTETLSRMFEETIPLGTVLRRKQLHQDYLPKYTNKQFKIGGRLFSVRPAWTDYKPDPKHVIVIGHILLCHLFDFQDICHQPSTRLFTDSIETRLDKFKSLLNAVNANKYPPPPIARKKVRA